MSKRHVIKRGDRLQIHREWCDSEDERYWCYIAREDEDGGRVPISAERFLCRLPSSPWHIVPVQVVQTDMVYYVGAN